MSRYNLRLRPLIAPRVLRVLDQSRFPRIAATLLWLGYLWEVAADTYLDPDYKPKPESVPTSSTGLETPSLPITVSSVDLWGCEAVTPIDWIPLVK